jgi:hypothetical protein
MTLEYERDTVIELTARLMKITDHPHIGTEYRKRLSPLIDASLALQTALQNEINVQRCCTLSDAELFAYTMTASLLRQAFQAMQAIDSHDAVNIAETIQTAMVEVDTVISTAMSTDIADIDIDGILNSITIR